jgi:transcriptional regulator with XRE-family HTH domain
MSYHTQGIVEQLRAARLTKGLSQRELSSLAGVPQAQISRIEAGTVDLRLSSLAALAHALDLELTLVPRKIVPAVRSLSRDALGVGRESSGAIQKAIQQMNETMRGLQISVPKLDGLAKLQKSIADLHRFGVPTLDLDALKRLQQTMEQIKHPAKQIAATNESLKLLQTIRNKVAHSPENDTKEAVPRPAYSLDEEDDDV